MIGPVYSVSGVMAQVAKQYLGSCCWVLPSTDDKVVSMLTMLKISAGVIGASISSSVCSTS